MRMPKKREHGRQKYRWIISGTIVGVLLFAGIGVCFYLKEKPQETVSENIQTEESNDTSKSQKNVSDDQVKRKSITYKGIEYQYNDHLSHYLFLGVDTRNLQETTIGKADAGQADALFLVSLDRVTKEITVIAIPRDTMTEIEMFDQSGKSLGKTMDHISLSYAYGDGKDKSCYLTKEAVSNLFYQIPIEGYCAISMDGLPTVMDTVGTLDVEVPDSSLEGVEPSWQKGSTVTLTAENIEKFVRYRDTEIDQSALNRLSRQQVFLEAWGIKMKELYNDDSSIVSALYEKMQPYLVTNMGIDRFAKLAEGASTSELVMQTIPGEGKEGIDFDEYYVDETAFYEMILQCFYEKVS